MKYKYIVASALSLAVVGASIISPFSYADDLQIADNLELAYQKLKSKIPTANMDGGYVALKQGSAYFFGFYRINYTISSYTYNTTSWVVIAYDSNLSSDTLSTLMTSNLPTTLTVYTNALKFGNDTYSFDKSSSNRVIAFSFPEEVKESQNSDNRVGVNLSSLQLLPFKRTPLQPMQNTVDSLLSTLRPTPTEPPYTIPAPAFPNLPDLWVNGDGNTYNIDLPDFDFNLDLPSYTMPVAVSIPADIVQKSSALYHIPLNVIDRYGLWWLVGLALICTVITLILNR